MSIDAAGFTRVVVVAPRTRVDVALPADLALIELMPSLLDMVGERSDDGGAPHDGWHLLDTDGNALDRSRGLRALGVLDGASLHLAPRRPATTEPIYDDVVEAIAATVRERRPDVDLRELGGALATLTGLVAAGGALFFAGPGPIQAGVAAMAALIALATATVIRRAGLSAQVSIASALGGSALAAVAGVLAVPGPLSPASFLLAGAAMAITAITAIMLAGTGAGVLSAVSVIGIFTAIGGFVGTLWGAPATTLLVLAGTLAVAAMTVAPWLAVRLSRLPMPVVPTRPDQLRDAELRPDAAMVARRAAVATEYLNGLNVGLILVASAGAAAAMMSSRLMGVLYAVVVIAVLLLRSRSLHGRPARMALLLGSLGAAAAGVIVLAWRSEGAAALPLAMVALAVAALALAIAVTSRRRRTSPMTQRTLDITENVLLILVLPLALGAMDLYTLVRRW